MNREQWQAALVIGYFYISARTLCCPSSVGRSQLFILRAGAPQALAADVLVSHLQTPPHPDPGERSELQSPVPAPAALMLTPISYKEKYPTGNRAPSWPDLLLLGSPGAPDTAFYF